MPSRVTINVTARDLTHAQLRRMRNNFSNLGQDMDRLLTRRTRQNFDRLGQSIRTARRDLNNLRGVIPDDEFFRLDNAVRRASQTMSRGFRRLDDRALNRLQTQITRINNGFRDLDRTGQIRVRVDTSALRRADARLNAWRVAQGRRAVRVRVDPDIDNHRFRRLLLRGLTAPVRAAGGLIGGTLSDGIGQGIANGVAAAGPLFGILLVAAIASLASIVGAALSGLLVTAFGLAFVGIGGVSAAMSKKVQSQWSTTLKGLKKDFAEVGEPMIPVLDRAIEKLGRMSHEFAPLLKKSIEEAAPITEKFINQIMDSFKSFGKGAFDPIMRAWEIFAPVFGEVWDQFMTDLGDAFGEMAKLVSEHPTEIAAALSIVFDTIVLIVKTITWLGEVWVGIMQNIGTSIGFVIDMMATLLDGALAAFGGLVDGAARAFSWLPGVGPALRQAKEDFAGFREQAVGDLRRVADGARGMGDELDKSNKKRKLEADISIWQAQLAKARKDLKNTTSQKAEAKLKADIKDLEAKLKNARGQLDALNGKIAYTYVKTVHTDSFPAQHGGIARRMGGITGAATGGVRGRMTMVGEDGPEIVNLPPGSHVRSRPDSQRVMREGGPAGTPMQVNLVVDGRVLARAMVEPHREIVRAKGGYQRFYGG